MFGTLFRKKKPPLRDGRWKEFNKHAILISVGHYVHDKKHGLWKEFYDSGELMLEEEYQHGEMHGRFISYYPNGRLMSEGHYSQGKREGYFNVYKEDGKHFKNLLFINNNLMEEVETIDKGFHGE